MKKRRLLHVTWNDSCSIDGGGTWKGSERVASMTPSRIDSVGWVLSETAKSVTLVSSVCESDNVSGEICIPKGCIVRKRILR